MGLLLVVRRSLGRWGGGGRDVGKTGLERGVLWIVLRAWPQGNVDRIAIIGATWGTVHELIDDQSLTIHLSLPLPLSHSNYTEHWMHMHTCTCSMYSHNSWGESLCWRANAFR